MGRRCLSLLIPMLLSPVQIFAAPSSQTLEQQFLNQQQRQRAQEKRITPAAPDVMFSPDMPLNSDKAFPVEKSCFRISRVQLSGTKSLLHWLPLQREANKALVHCPGANGINILMGQLQNTLIGHGYVTTRVLVPQQDLKSGVLRLVVMPGYV